MIVALTANQLKSASEPKVGECKVVSFPDWNLY